MGTVPTALVTDAILVPSPAHLHSPPSRWPSFPGTSRRAGEGWLWVKLLKSRVTGFVGVPRPHPLPRGVISFLFRFLSKGVWGYRAARRPDGPTASALW